MEKRLLKIANLLFINSQNIKEVGLLDGKLGAAIYLYEYARHFNKSGYHDLADFIICETLNQLNKSELTHDVYKGISGIGWGIEYLIKNGFIEGDSDEVLMDFDSRIQSFINAMESCEVAHLYDLVSLKEFMLSVDVYIFMRSSKNINNIDNVKKIFNFYWQVLKSDIEVSIGFLNSFTLFIIHLKHLNIPITILNNCFNNKILNIAYQDALMETKCSHTDLIRLKRIIKKTDLLDDGLNKYIINQFPLINDDLEKQTILVDFITELLYKNKTFPVTDIETVDRFLEHSLIDMNDENLCLRTGIAGLGLGILKSGVYETKI